VGRDTHVVNPQRRGNAQKERGNQRSSTLSDGAASTLRRASSSCTRERYRSINIASRAELIGTPTTMYTVASAKPASESRGETAPTPVIAETAHQRA